MSRKNDASSHEKDSDPSFLVGIMHVTKEPWLSIVKNGQIPYWEKVKYKNFSVLYFFGFANRLTSFVDSKIESLRWTRGRYASYGISYFLMLILRPWVNIIPKSEIVDEYQSRNLDELYLHRAVVLDNLIP